ncbi:hypothetical protein, partial [Escherichia coli]
MWKQVLTGVLLIAAG